QLLTVIAVKTFAFHHQLEQFTAKFGETKGVAQTLTVHKCGNRPERIVCGKFAGLVGGNNGEWKQIAFRRTFAEGHLDHQEMDVSACDDDVVYRMNLTDLSSFASKPAA